MLETLNIASIVGEIFLKEITRVLAQETGMEFVFIGEIERPSFNRVQAISFWAVDKHVDNYSYELACTPCEDVFGQGICIYKNHVQEFFPEDEDLKTFGIESYVGIPLFSANGDAIGLVAALHNKPIKNAEHVSKILNLYTTRIAAELDYKNSHVAIQSSETRFSSMFLQSAAGIALFDINGKLFRANPTFTDFFECEEAEMLNSRFQGLFNEENENSLQEIWAALINGKRGSHRADIKFHTKDGSDKWADISISRTEDNAGKLLNVNCVMTDITAKIKASNELSEYKNKLEFLVTERTQELEKATQIAEKANLAKSEFLSAMSHDLRTPLNAIIGFSQLVENDAKDKASDKHIGYVKQIHNSGQHLLSLINQVLDLAKIESGRATYALEAVDPKEIINECLSSLNSIAEKENVTIYDMSSIQNHAVKADRTRLMQILLNLLSNAIKYNKPNGTVAIEISEKDGDLLEFSINDTGIGIDKSNQKLVFQEFQRMHDESTGIEGTGIGLSITQKLVIEMGGEIGFTSQVGVGSSFWFTLPVFQKT